MSTKYNELPSISCPSGIRAQIVRGTPIFIVIVIHWFLTELPELLGWKGFYYFPCFWDMIFIRDVLQNTDSVDHKSHVAFLSTGPDTGSCSDPNFPVVIPRIFMEVYWASNDFDSVRSQAMNSTQPFVYVVELLRLASLLIIMSLGTLSVTPLGTDTMPVSVSC